jgi:predicted nuclease of predicted toxin-antitoxin system
MTIWVDAQMSPALAVWISNNFPVKTVALRDLRLRDATDREIFFAARSEAVVVMTKDSDFVRLLDELGTPPQVIWITCGNTSNARLKEILAVALSKSLQLLESGERLVEINAI